MKTQIEQVREGIYQASKGDTFAITTWTITSSSPNLPAGSARGASPPRPAPAVFKDDIAPEKQVESGE